MASPNFPPAGVSLEATGHVRTEGHHVRALIADHDEIYRYGLCQFLSTAIDIVGQAANGSDALDLALTLLPDVVLIDSQLPGMSAPLTARQIKQHVPSVRVVIMTNAEASDDVRPAVEAGASAYVVKGQASELLCAVQAAAAGEAYFSPSVAKRLIDALARAKPHPLQDTDLTAKEHEVLQLLVRGERNSDVARALSISERTVNNHVSTIYRKFGVACRAAAVTQALRRGLAHI